MKTAAIYTRVSSDQQKENKTIGSQVDELLHYAQEQGFLEMKGTAEPYWFVQVLKK